jgi:hypothetical protein
MECAERAYFHIKDWLYRSSKRAQFTLTPGLAQVASRAADAKQEQLDNAEKLIAELEVESHCSAWSDAFSEPLQLKEKLEDFKADTHSAEAPLSSNVDQGEDPGGVQDVKAVLLRAARAEARAALLEKTLEELCQNRDHQIHQLQEAAAQANWQMELLQGHADELARILLPAEDAAAAAATAARADGADHEETASCTSDAPTVEEHPVVPIEAAEELWRVSVPDEDQAFQQHVMVPGTRSQVPEARHRQLDQVRQATMPPLEGLLKPAACSLPLGPCARRSSCPSGALSRGNLATVCTLPQWMPRSSGHLLPPRPILSRSIEEQRFPKLALSTHF